MCGAPNQRLSPVFIRVIFIFFLEGGHGPSSYSLAFDCIKKAHIMLYIIVFFFHFLLSLFSEIIVDYHGLGKKLL